MEEQEPEDREYELHKVCCYFVHCTAINPDEKQFHRSVLGLLKQLGVVFYTTGPYPTPEDPNPELKVEENGSLVKIVLASHRLLKQSNPSWGSDDCFQGMYGALGLDESFLIGARPLCDDFTEYETAVQDMAHGRREFLKLVIPHVKPCLAYADDTWGGGDVKDKQVEAAQLKRLFWVTYFGPHYVEQHGKEFLMNTPAWRVEELDGGVLVTVTETFLDFARNEQKETLNYLKQKFKNIRPNRFRIHPAF